MDGANAGGSGGGSRHRVFVYGTLRGGACNAWRMAGAVRVGAASVKGRLYQVSWYPAVVLDEAAGDVKGEVWEAGAELLERLDRFEGVPASGEGGEYRRVVARVRLDGGREATAWVWEWAAGLEGLRLIEGGDWLVAGGG